MGGGAAGLGWGSGWEGIPESPNPTGGPEVSGGRRCHWNPNPRRWGAGAGSPARGPGRPDGREVRRRWEAGHGAPPEVGRRRKLRPLSWPPQSLAALQALDTPLSPPVASLSVPARTWPRGPPSAFGFSQADPSWNFGPPSRARSPIRAVYLLTSNPNTASPHVPSLDTAGRHSRFPVSVPLGSSSTPPPPRQLWSSLGPSLSPTVIRTLS